MSEDNKHPSSTMVGGFGQQGQATPAQTTPGQPEPPRQAVVPAQQIAPTLVHPQLPQQALSAQQQQAQQQARPVQQQAMPAQQAQQQQALSAQQQQAQHQAIPVQQQQAIPVQQQQAIPVQQQQAIPVQQAQHQQQAMRAQRQQAQHPQQAMPAQAMPIAQVHQDGDYAPPPQGAQGGSFLVTSLRRSFKQRIDPSEVSLSERAQLDMANIHEPLFQAFLTWRHSLLFVVALLLVPVVGLHIYELIAPDNNDLPEIFSTLQYLQIAIEVFFTITVFLLLKGWTNWPRQRKHLFVAWLLYFATPFLLQLYPYRTAFEDGTVNQAEGLLMGMIFSIGSMMTLAPKAFALLPGILRASVICKLLFPGSSAPGWLITMLGPIYAILIYILLSMPLQLSGNGLFIAAMIGLIGAQLYLSRQGIKLARPESYDEAFTLLSRIRAIYLTLNLIGVTFAIVAMLELFEQLNIPWASILTLVLSIMANVLLLTLVATDLLIANLHKANLLANDPSTQQQRNEFSQRIATFAQEKK